MNVNLFLKRPKMDNSVIMAVCSYKGRVYKLYSGVSVEVKYWDGELRRARQRREYPDHETINILLDKFEGDVKTIFTNAAIGRTLPTVDQVKEELAERKREGETKLKPKRMGFLEFMRWHVERTPYKGRTKLSYGTTGNMIEGFERTINKKLQFEDIDIHFYNSFRAWVAITPKRPKRIIKDGKKVDSEVKEYYAINTFGTFVKHIKAIMREAGPEGERLHENTEYKHRKFIKEAEDADTVYLNDKELERIYTMRIDLETISLAYPDLCRLHIDKKIKALTKTKNLFLIGCYTALRISDFSRLDHQHIQEYIRIKPKKGQKKNEDVVIPKHRIIREIVAGGFDLREKMSDQHFNEHVKDLCRLAGINEPVTTVRTEGLRQVTRTSEKWKLVSSHCCRRSGATNMFMAGIPSISIMKITGHRTERLFMKYLKISQEENARLLAEHPFFK